jgi:uncharacterized membrane protein
MGRHTGVDLKLLQLSREDQSVSIVPAIKYLVVCGLAHAGVLVDPTPAPFWKSPPVYKTMVDERALPVSAKIEKTKSDGKAKERLLVMAAGHVSVPIGYAWKKVLQFERLPKISSHFNKAEYFADKKRLHIEVSALGYKAQMFLQMKFEEKAGWKEIQWEAVEGAFQGMKGIIRLEDFEGRKTEMSLVSDHETDKLPLPAVLKSFVIEVVGQRVAGLMREYIEDEYKKDNKK